MTVVHHMPYRVLTVEHAQEPRALKCLPSCMVLDWLLAYGKMVLKPL